MVRRDVLGVMTWFAFGERAEPPYFVRNAERPREPEALARMLAVAVRELGVRVPAGWAHAALGIPQAKAGEPVLVAGAGVSGADGV